MHEMGNRFAREIAAAIARAAAADKRVEAWREIATAAGFEMKLSLEEVVRSALEMTARPGNGVKAPRVAVTPALHLTAKDVRLLKSLRIRADAATEPV